MHVATLKSLLLATLAAAALNAGAAVHSIDVGTPLPRFALVKPGVHRYLRYVRDGESNKPIDIWMREVRFEQRDGKQLLRVRQRWDGVAPGPYTLWLDSWFEPGTFRPISHERTSERDGKRKVEGFVFAPDRVTGMKDLADNVQKDLVVESGEPTFNFETDIEFLQAMPMAEGEEFRINFYHPGGPAPQRYTWKVVGSESISGPAGPVECWVLTTDYNRPGTVSKFWFAKGAQVMVRQESVTPKGVLVKTLIE
ncbi:DUF3108 domain-containing protein [Massilia agilis]|uniref:DUF3108 domain-containing protein n=1 Tax=Massilia agilis TaxID=1811226 RepID=A0ABT2D7L2_9BURK|nr:DUF3108 domain-containing protein [Massilia agilis]MCS0807297.1 DUF3108 domain-containing protein [Massilia agilis]